MITYLAHIYMLFRTQTETRTTLIYARQEAACGDAAMLQRMQYVMVTSNYSHRPLILGAQPYVFELHWLISNI